MKDGWQAAGTTPLEVSRQLKLYLAGLGEVCCCWSYHPRATSSGAKVAVELRVKKSTGEDIGGHCLVEFPAH